LHFLQNSADVDIYYHDVASRLGWIDAIAKMHLAPDDPDCNGTTVAALYHQRVPVDDAKTFDKGVYLG